MAPGVQSSRDMATPCSIPALALTLALVTSCSGAASSELFGPAAESSALPNEPGGPSAPAAPADEPDDADQPDERAPGPSSESSGDEDERPAEPPRCVAESEPNDGFEDADWFTSCATGTVKGRDVDLVAASVPPGVKEVAIAHAETGRVRYRLFVNGVPVPSADGEPPSSMPAVPNATYTFRVEAEGAGSARRAWKLEVAFQ